LIPLGLEGSPTNSDEEPPQLRSSPSTSPDSKFLCCNSDRGTIHVRCLDAKGSPKGAEGSDGEKDHCAKGAKKKATNSMFGGVAKYFTSEWSFAWWA